MGLYVQPTKGTVYVNGQQIAGPYHSTSGSDFVSLASNSSATIQDNGVTAALLSTQANPTPISKQTFSPPTQSVYQIYYNQSYRWQVTCPGGSIGIRI